MAGAFQDHLFVAQSQKLEAGVERVDLRKRLAGILHQRRAETLADGDVEAELRLFGIAAAGVLEDQLVANSLTHAARNVTDIDGLQPLLDANARRVGRIHRAKALAFGAACESERRECRSTDQGASTKAPIACGTRFTPRHSRSFAARRSPSWVFALREHAPPSRASWRELRFPHCRPYGSPSARPGASR